MQVRDMIARRVGELVHAEGFDSETGHKLLGDKQLFMLGGHKTRGVRLIKGSAGANMDRGRFISEVENIYLKARSLNRSSDAWRQHMLMVDRMLRPGTGEDKSGDESMDLAEVHTSSPRPETGG